MKNYEKFFLSDFYACIAFISLTFASFGSIWLWAAMVVAYIFSEINERKKFKDDKNSS